MENGHRSLFVSIVLACLVVGGLLWLMSVPAPQPTIPSSAKKPASKPAPRRQASPSPAPAPSWSSARRTPARDARWENLDRTCRYWTERVARAGATSGDRTFQQAACQRQAEYARQTGRSWQPPRVVSPTAPAQTNHVVRVPVYECGRHRYGSIDYRNCRASEKKRLEQGCRSVSAKWDYARGDERIRLAAHRDAWCRAARQYQIVN